MDGIDHRPHELPSVDSAPPAWVSRPSIPDLPEFSPADSEELRFTLQEMFLATTLAAVMLALFRSLGIYGAVFSFLSAVIATLFVVPYLYSQDRPRQCLYFDFVWGIVMPIVCLVFDPFVFKHGDFDADIPWISPQVHINPSAYFAWPLMAGQITTLGMVLAWGKSLRPIAPIVAGTLATGFVIALCAGICLVFPALLGTLMFGIGLLGFTPFFTCRTYFRRMRLMWFVAKGERPYEWQLALAALGVVICLALAWAIGTLVLTVVPPGATISW